MFSLKEALEKDVVCQKRTGHNKQFVFLHGDKVIKGPFKTERVDTILRRKAYFIKWKTPMVVLPDDTVLQDPDLPTGANLFLSYPNLAKDYPVEADWCGETFTEYKYRVLRRSGLIKLSDAIKITANEPVIGQLLRDLLLALSHLYILNVGDVHFANVLADLQKRSLHIVDYDENRSNDRNDEFFYLSKVPGHEAVSVIERYGRQFYSHIILGLRELLKNPLVTAEIPGKETEDELRSRVGTAITMFNAYAAIPPSIPKGSKAAVVVPDVVRSYNDYKKLTLIQLKAICNGRTPKVRTVGNKEDIIQRLIASDHNPNDREKGPVGQMHWGGLRGGASKTYSGYTLDVMKSALQKYIRRGMLDKALMAAAELFRMAEVGGEAGQTSVINRLAVIAVEDIGPANIPLVTAVLEELNKDIRDPAVVFGITQALCQSEKTRLPSHLRYVYGTEAGQKEAIKRGLQVDDVDIDHELLDYLTEWESPFWKEDDPDEIRDYAELFYKRLRERNPNAEAWLSRYFAISEGCKVTKRYMRTSPDIVIWAMLDTLILPSIVEIYRKAYYKQSESGPFLMALVTAFIYNAPFAKEDIRNYIEVWRDSEGLGQLLDGKYTLDVSQDTFVLDKHTAIGRRNGKTRDDFVNEGSLVNNQSLKYYDPILHEIYNGVIAPDLPVPEQTTQVEDPEEGE